jgi:hypothetical protein
MKKVCTVPKKLFFKKIILFDVGRIFLVKRGFRSFFLLFILALKNLSSF